MINYSFFFKFNKGSFIKFRMNVSVVKYNLSLINSLAFNLNLVTFNNTIFTKPTKDQ